MDNLSQFTDVLQDIMAERSLTVKDINAGSNIGINTINVWLQKTGTPSLNNLVRLSDYLKCSADYLTGRTDYNYFSERRIATFAERLKSLMQERKISTRRFCADTNFSKSQIYYFLNGKSKPNLNNLIRIIDYFGCSLDYLIGRD